MLLPETPWARKVMKGSLSHSVLVLEITWRRFKNSVKDAIKDVGTIIRTGSREDTNRP